MSPSGKALVFDASIRRFDSFYSNKLVIIAQMVEYQIVALNVVGSIPINHRSRLLWLNSIMEMR